jgi:hypothetical protein
MVSETVTPVSPSSEPISATASAAQTPPSPPAHPNLIQKKSKRSGRIRPPRDSLLVYIPLNVTADLGVAMKRARAKNIAKCKQLQPHLFEKKQRKEGNGAGEDDKKSMTSTNLEEDGSHAGSMNTSDDGHKDGAGSGDGDGDSQERNEDETLMDLNKIGSEVRREQFSSVVDYLEAKYARGVMIHDLDERIREKKKQKDGKAGEGTGTAAGAKHAAAAGDDLSVLSDSEAGSCYSEDSGDFIDDSDLRTDVAHQILASSAFGTTKIEADAVKARGIGNGQDDVSVGDDDHAFFVNIGDLEMEDGWNEDIEEDQDWLALKKSKGYVQLIHFLWYSYVLIEEMHACLYILFHH